MDMGEKMLRGWVMTERMCEITGCPLMEDPGSKRLWSSGLGRFVDKAEPTSTTKVDVPIPREGEDVPGSTDEDEPLSLVRGVLVTKLRDYARALSRTDDIEQSAALLQLMRNAASTLADIKR